MVSRILLPLDLSPLGEVKLPVAEEYARAFCAELILLHVLHGETRTDDGGTSPEEARARAYLDAIAARLHVADVRARPLVVVGPVAATVLEIAREELVDLVLIGSNVRTGLSWLLLGGVAEEIIRGAPCPVLLVRPEMTDPPAVPAVRSFAEDAARAGPLSPRLLGLRVVETARVVGSVGRASELSASFRPLHRRKEDEYRYQSIYRAMERGDQLPPVELYKLGYGYYVLDGNHRVAAAKQLGQIEIDANVTEFVALGDAEGQRLFAERRAFERATGLTRVGVAQPGNYARLQDLISAFADQHGLDNMREAAGRWYAEVFRPVAVRIRSLRVGQRYPGKRTADIVLRLADHRRLESERLSRELSWEEAIESFVAMQRAAD